MVGGETARGEEPGTGIGADRPVCGQPQGAIDEVGRDGAGLAAPADAAIAGVEPKDRAVDGQGPPPQRVAGTGPATNRLAAARLPPKYQSDSSGVQGPSHRKRSR